LGAKFLATGHYAKLFRHEGRDTFYVHTSNDERHDQSSYLARLPHDILSHLMLPLSDLTKKEVLKLADNFGLQADETGLKMHECLKDSKMTLEFLEQTLPERFRQEGEIQGV